MPPPAGFVVADIPTGSTLATRVGTAALAVKVKIIYRCIGSPSLDGTHKHGTHKHTFDRAALAYTTPHHFLLFLLLLLLLLPPIPP
jgi:hypothetical protein